MMTPKQYLLINLSKMIVELVGTAVLGIFYLTVGGSQAGMLLGYWIITLFGVAISGAHFNPCVTLACMLRKNSSFGTRRLRGILYIAAQMAGGLIAAIVSKFLLNQIDGSNLAISPKMKNADGINEYRFFSSLISECAGTAYFVFLIMICTDKKTQFSTDRVINCFIMASSYVASRLMAGSHMVTVLYSDPEQTVDGVLMARVANHAVGPLLNPALAFGQMLLSFDFKFILQYFFMPLAGSAIALVFYEFVFVKSQEYLEDDTSSAGDNKELDIPDIPDSPPKKKADPEATSSD